jgi:hypothetical protein
VLFNAGLRLKTESIGIYVIYYNKYITIILIFISKKVTSKKNSQKRLIHNLVLKFYNRQRSITSVFSYKTLNCSILKSNLSLPKHYLSLKSCFRKASLKQLKKRLNKRLPRLRKKSSSKSRRPTKPRSLTCGYNELGT